MRLAPSLAMANVLVLAAAVLASTDKGVADRVAFAPAPTASAAPLATEAPAPSAVPSPSPSPTVAVVRPAPAGPQVAPPATAAPVPAPVLRAVTHTGFRPYATTGPVVLHFPGDVVEAVGLHESGHDGAQPQSPVPDAGRIGLLASRSRGTNTQGAADVVVDPTRPVRSPVTGRVLRAGTYQLYCKTPDHFLVIEPEGQPGWEVKLLHFEGLRVAAGDSVRAGVTVVGSRARVLPFRSQVDKHTVAPHWPHVHVEVVDTAIPDRPSGGGCD